MTYRPLCPAFHVNGGGVALRADANVSTQAYADVSHPHAGLYPVRTFTGGRGCAAHEEHAVRLVVRCALDHGVSDSGSQIDESGGGAVDLQVDASGTEAHVRCHRRQGPAYLAGARVDGELFQGRDAHEHMALDFALAEAQGQKISADARGKIQIREI